MNKHVGSHFDDFLSEEGLLEEAKSVAAKRVFVFRLKQELKKPHLLRRRTPLKPTTTVPPS